MDVVRAPGRSNDSVNDYIAIECSVHPGPAGVKGVS